MRKPSELLKVPSYTVEDLFEENSPDLKWCLYNATFEHKDACEFVVWVGNPEELQLQNEARVSERAKAAGCSDEFIELLQANEDDPEVAYVMLYC